MPTTVILGTGIIGLSTAYYLSLFVENEVAKNPLAEKHEIHLVEATHELFASASGKAAGFLAKDWFQPAVTPLGQFSFDLHRKLAEEHDGRSKWGWSESTSYSLDRDDGEDDSGEEDDSPVRTPPLDTQEDPSDQNIADVGETARSHRGSPQKSDLDWLMSGSSRSILLDDPNVAPHDEDWEDLPRWLHAKRSSLQLISGRATTGQVDPYRLCQFLLEESLARGVKLHYPAQATQLQHVDPNVPTSKTSIRLRFSSSGESQSSDGPSDVVSKESLSVPHVENPRILDIPCDSIVIAAGCWTPRVYRTLFPNAGRIPRVTALAGHSVRLKSKYWSGGPRAESQSHADDDTSKRVSSSTSSDSTGAIPALDSASDPSSLQAPTQLLTTEGLAKDIKPKLQGCHAVFTSDTAGYSPEIFSRLGGDVWLGGYNSAFIPLPSLATEAVPNSSSIDILVKTGKALCGEDVEVLREGLCFRPVAPMGRPVIARMHEADLGDGAKVGGSVLVATGHGPWGISLSLGTGHVVGEMLLGREPSVDVSLLSSWEAQTV